MTSTAEVVLLFDLDGTIIAANSFPLWAGEMLLGRAPRAALRRRLGVALKTAAAATHRKVACGSHAAFKQRLQEIWASAATGDVYGAADRLVDRLRARVRPNLAAVLDEVAAGTYDAVLTTAAAAEYAVPLARRLGVAHVIATERAPDGVAVDNVGLIKRDRTLAFLAAQGWRARPRVLFTDHEEDLPLLRESSAAVWLGAPDELAAVAAQLHGVASLAARDLDPEVIADWVRAGWRRQEGS